MGGANSFSRWYCPLLAASCWKTVSIVCLLGGRNLETALETSGNLHNFEGTGAGPPIYDLAAHQVAPDQYVLHGLCKRCSVKIFTLPAFFNFPCVSSIAASNAVSSWQLPCMISADSTTLLLGRLTSPDSCWGFLFLALVKLSPQEKNACGANMPSDTAAQFRDRSSHIDRQLHCPSPAGE